MTSFKLLIGGNVIVGSTGNWEDVVNPATDEVIGRVTHAGPEDLDAALAAAERGLETGGPDLCFGQCFPDRVAPEGRHIEILEATKCMHPDAADPDVPRHQGCPSFAVASAGS